MIERLLFDALVHYGNEGREVGAIAREFKRRNDQWLEFVLADLDQAPEAVLAIPRSLHRQTSALFNFRHILVHSRWMGMDNTDTVWVDHIKQKGDRWIALDAPIPMHHFARNLKAAEQLTTQHTRFLVEVILRLPPERAREYFRPASADPNEKTHPKQAGRPYRPSEDWKKRPKRR